jgi:hypothetical protein
LLVAWVREGGLHLSLEYWCTDLEVCREPIVPLHGGAHARSIVHSPALVLLSVGLSVDSHERVVAVLDKGIVGTHGLHIDVPFIRFRREQC